MYIAEMNWIDSNGFDWLKWWHNYFRNQSYGTQLIVMDNCQGHESDHQIPGLRTEFLPEIGTTKYMPFGLGLLNHGKI